MTSSVRWKVGDQARVKRNPALGTVTVAEIVRSRQADLRLPPDTDRITHTVRFDYEDMEGKKMGFCSIDDLIPADVEDIG